MQKTGGAMPAGFGVLFYTIFRIRWVTETGSLWSAK